MRSSRLGSETSSPPHVLPSWGYTTPPELADTWARHGRDDRNALTLDRQMGDHIFPIGPQACAGDDEDAHHVFSNFHARQLSQLTRLGREKQARMRALPVAMLATRG